MRPVVLALSIALVAAACGGSKDSATQPPPPPVNRVAALRAADSSMLELTARRAPIAALFHAVDVNGAIVPDAHITCTTPAGFVLTGDSLLAPAAEIRGKLRCSATTILSAAAAAGPQRSDPLPNPADSLTITAGIDLRLFAWRVETHCTGGTGDWPQLSYRDSAGVFHFSRADSIVQVAAVDTILYAGDAATFPNYGTVGQLVYRATRTSYAPDGRVVVDTLAAQRQMRITEQRVDTLFLLNTTTNQYGLPMVRVGTTGRRYEGGGWCLGDLAAPLTPALFEAVAP